MKKIILQDNFKRFHIFEGNVFYFVTPEGCEIIDRGPNSDRRSPLAHFAQYQWVKYDHGNAQEEYPPQKTAAFLPQVQPLDDFTQADLEKRRHAPPPDFGSVGKGKPIDTIPDRDRESVERFKEKNGVGPDNSKTRQGASAGEPEHMTATEVRKRTEQWERNLGEEITSIKEKPLDLSPEEQRLAFSELKRKYGASPVQVVLGPLDEAAEEALQELKLKPPVIKPKCETCGGAGIVPDPETDDPLDTKICPDC